MSGDEDELVDGADRVIREDLEAIVQGCPEMNALSGSALLLTGATGFVGRYLVESVIRFNRTSAGPRCVMTLPSRRPDLLRARYRSQVEAGEVVVIDWSRGYGLTLPERRWDYLIHGAATADPRVFLSDPNGSFRDMIAMAATIAEVAQASDAKRLVLISSGAVYGAQPLGTQEISEGFLGAPDLATVSSSYGEGKRVAELLFLLSGVDHRAARVFSLLGPYQDLASSFAVPDLIRQGASTGVLRLTGDGSATRSYCYAADLSIFLFKLLLGSPVHDVYNVGSRQGTVTVADIAHLVSNIFGGLEIKTARQAAAAAPGSGRYVPQLDRMYELHAPRFTFTEGLLRTCHSLFDRGLIDRKPSIDLDNVGALG